MKRFIQTLSKIFHPGDPLPLGRWILKPSHKQVSSPVADPGYQYLIHWSKVPPGKLRQEAIKNHLSKVRGNSNLD